MLIILELTKDFEDVNFRVFLYVTLGCILRFRYEEICQFQDVCRNVCSNLSPQNE